MPVPSVLSPEPPTSESPQDPLSTPPSLCQSPGLVATNEILCIGDLGGSLYLQLFLPGRQKPCCFSQLDVIWVPFSLWCCRLGSPAWGLDPTLLRRNILATELYLQIFSCHAWEPSHPSHVSALSTNHIVVKWFLLSVQCYKAPLQLVFSLFFGMISLQFSCNSRLVLGGG